MLLVGGDSALTGLQNITIVAALPFVVVMVGLCFALVKDLRQDPLMVRRRYAAAAVEQAVVDGVTRHGDDFTLSVEEKRARAPRGSSARRPEPAVTRVQLLRTAPAAPGPGPPAPGRTRGCARRRSR